MTIKPDLKRPHCARNSASRGIGAAIAVALAQAGAAVAVNYRERADEADALWLISKNMGGRAGRDRRRRIAVGCCCEAWSITPLGAGPVDILVNNAGMAIVRGIDDLPKTISMHDRGHLKSAFLCTQACCRRCGRKMGPHRQYLVRRRGVAPGAIGVHYNASKAGMKA